MHPAAVCMPVGTSQSHISNNRRSSGVEVRYDSNISPLDKHTGVFPMSKRQLAGDCIVLFTEISCLA